MVQRRRGSRTGQTGDEVPRSLALLWKRADLQAPGRRKTLSLERIVAAAIQIADADGLPALSMARLAKRLGCATMSLYRHVANKDELEVFMMDTAPGPPPVVDVHAAGWRSGLETWARALQAVYHRHPWILQIVAGRPPLEPGQLAWLDGGLRTLSGTRLTPGEKVSVLLLVLNYVRGEAQVTTGLLQSHKRTIGEQREMDAWYGRMLARLIDPERFPALAEVSAAGVFGAGDGDGATDFDFGLSRILAGVEALLRGRRQ